MSEATLDRDSAIPLYVQLADVIRENIRTGLWGAGHRIPSENELVRVYGISRMTARGVLARLVDEGLLFRVQGKGTFVAHEKVNAQSPWYMGLRGQIEQDGRVADTQVLGVDVVPAEARVASELGIAEGESLIVVRRLRSIDGAPQGLQESHVPLALAPGLADHDLGAEHVVTVLEREYGLKMSHVTETLEVEAAPKSLAAELAVPTGAPLLLLEQTISSPSRVAFEFTRAHFRGDLTRLKFVYDV